MASLEGRTLGNYKLDGPLGRGGMASVYRAVQSTVKRYVAVKVMAPEIADEPGFVERFQREAQVVASLEHPHILPLIDYGESDGLHYMVMRYMEGGSLQERMKEKPLTLSEIAHFLSQIASALDYAHKRGVIHRDLKPNNVLLDKEDNAYLTDFGIARIVQTERKLTSTGSVMGTPAYMSPEQAMGKVVDARSDIYTLGVMLYEMVLNRLPFAADTPTALLFQHVYEQPIPPRSINPNLKMGVELVLDRAMSKVPDARYQSAMELSRAFASAIAESSSPQNSITSDPDEASTMRLNPDIVEIITLREANSAKKQAPTTYKEGKSEQPTVAGNPAPTAIKMNASNVAAAPKRAPVGLIVVGVAIVALLLGGGGFFALKSFGDNNSTATQNGILTSTSANLQTQTAVQVAMVLSYTATFTPSATLTKTPTPTITLTPSSTSTPTPTATATFTITASQTPTATITPTRTLPPSPTPSSTVAVTNSPIATSTAIALSVTTQPNINVNSPNAIIQNLAQKDFFPANNHPIRIAMRNSGTLVGSPDDENVFYYIVLSPVNTKNFVLTTDFTITSSDAGVNKTACGLLYNGRVDGDTIQDFVAPYFLRSQDYFMRVFKNNAWASTPITNTTAKLNTANGGTNQLALIVNNGAITVVLNGDKLYDTDERTFTFGQLGYFMIKGLKGDNDRCDYTNTYLWKLDD